MIGVRPAALLGSLALAGGCAGSPPPNAAAPVAAARPPSPAAPLPSSSARPKPAALLAAIRASFEPSLAAPARPPDTTPIAALVRAPGPDEAGLEMLHRLHPSWLPPATIQRTVRKVMGRFRDCYLRARLRDPSLEGRVMVRLTIGTDGRVLRAEEETSTLGDRAARECVLGQFFELRFPEGSTAPLHVRYPLLFTKSGSEALESLRDAKRQAAPPPPGFKEALRDGRRVTPVAAPAPTSAPPLPSKTTNCDADDPMCDAL